MAEGLTIPSRASKEEVLQRLSGHLLPERRGRTERPDELIGVAKDDLVQVRCGHEKNDFMRPVFVGRVEARGSGSAIVGSFEAEGARPLSWLLYWVALVLGGGGVLAFAFGGFHSLVVPFLFAGGAALFGGYAVRRRPAEHPDREPIENLLRAAADS